MRKNVKAFLIIAVVILAANCNSQQELQPSVSDIANAWLDINSKLAPQDMTETFFSDGIVLQIEEFNDSLNRFINSPVGHLYQTHRKEDMRLLEISPAVNRLKAAIQNGREREVFSNTLEIDRAVSILQRVDAELSVTSQLSSFMLFFFLSLIIIAITLILTIMHNRHKIEELQHQQSMSFSRETLLAQEHERTRIARELHDTVA